MVGQGEETICIHTILIIFDVNVMMVMMITIIMMITMMIVMITEINMMMIKIKMAAQSTMLHYSKALQSIL